MIFFYDKKTWNYVLKSRGFTLIEMLTVLAIFFIITSVVIFNHSKFNSSIIVTNLAYEVAIAVRQAQVYGLAVKQDLNQVGPVEYAYGVYFSVGGDSEKKIFYIFADKDGDQQFDPTGDPCDGTDECQESISIRGDARLETLSTNSNSNSGELTILFLRPNPVAIIRDDGNNSSTVSGRQRASIELYSEKADKSKEIVVELSGQVSVQDSE